MNKDQAYYAKKYKQLGRDRKRMICHGIWFDPELNRYIDYGRGRRTYSSYCKRKCNKKLRHYEVEHSAQRGYYRKLTEYWWDMY